MARRRRSLGRDSRGRFTKGHGIPAYLPTRQGKLLSRPPPNWRPPVQRRELQRPASGELYKEIVKRAGPQYGPARNGHGGPLYKAIKKAYKAHWLKKHAQ